MTFLFSFQDSKLFSLPIWMLFKILFLFIIFCHPLCTVFSVWKWLCAFLYGCYIKGSHDKNRMELEFLILEETRFFLWGFGSRANVDLVWRKIQVAAVEWFWAESHEISFFISFKVGTFQNQQISTFLSSFTICSRNAVKSLTQSFDWNHLTAIWNLYDSP